METSEAQRSGQSYSNQPFPNSTILSQYLVLRDTLCSREAYGKRPKHRGDKVVIHCTGVGLKRTCSGVAEDGSIPARARAGGTASEPRSGTIAIFASCFFSIMACATCTYPATARGGVVGSWRCGVWRSVLA